MKLWLTIVVLSIFSSHMFAQKRPRDHVIHGTINVVFGNQHGLVVLTDSKLTAGNRQLAVPGQKLFKLDEHTVCTIAGFVAADVPQVPELYTATSSIINSYRKELAGKPRQTMQEMLTSMSFLLNFYLSSIASVRNAVGAGSPLDSYRFQLLIVGYDTDGQPKIGTFTLAPNATGEYRWSDPVGMSLTAVGKQLVWAVSGQPDVANELLLHPERKRGDAVLADYAAAMQRDKGESLDLDNLTRLAQRLAHYTSLAHPSVGGADQVAVLQNGRIKTIRQEAFPDVQAPIKFNLLSKNDIKGRGGIVFGEGIVGVWVRNTFVDDERKLDGHFFFANTFKNSVLIYDGGHMHFDRTNLVDNCVLVLGSNVEVTSNTVRNLVSGFPWSRVLRAR